jgi:RNA polymerase sigma-70 factor (ECF subfamily)
MGNRATVAPRQAKVSADQFVRTFSEVRADLLGTLYCLLGNHEDAQDAVQEAFLKCWRRRQAVRSIRNLRAWIFRVGLNVAKDLCRNAWRRRLRPLASVALFDHRAGTSPTDTLLHQEALDRIRAVLADLRPEERDVFLLRQNSDLTYEEIAALRRRPVGTIKTQMRSALHKLRGVLQESV